MLVLELCQWLLHMIRLVLHTALCWPHTHILILDHLRDLVLHLHDRLHHGHLRARSVLLMSNKALFDLLQLLF